MKKIKLVKKEYITHTEEKETEYYVDGWFAKFLKNIFEDQWIEFKDDLTRSAEREAQKTIKAEMTNYKRQLDREILEEVELVEPGIVAKEWHEFDLPDLAPAPNIINGIAYPKRLVIKKAITVGQSEVRKS